jgi:hypothetical protein
MKDLRDHFQIQLLFQGTRPFLSLQLFILRNLISAAFRENTFGVGENFWCNGNLVLRNKES